MVDGVVHSERPFPPPEGRVVAGRILTPAQATVAAWPRARARWFLLRREPLALPGGTIAWAMRRP